MDVRKCLDELKFVLKIKTDIELSEYLGVSKSALTQWLSRGELPSKWQLKINNLMVNKDSGVFIGSNNGSVSINTSNFNHSQEVKEIIELLRYAPPAYLDKLKKILEKYKHLIDEEDE